MWPFKKPKPTPKPSCDGSNDSKKTWFAPTSLQIGDDCICVCDDPHSTTHQTLLVLGKQYKVRDIQVAGIGGCDAETKTGFGGPWVKVIGVTPIKDCAWTASRFEKVVKTSILTQVMEPVDLDLEKLNEEVY